MFPRQYKLEEAAEVVWTAAKKGRQCARNGFRGAAVAYMEGLSAVASNEGTESLLRIARSAAYDINRMLNGDPPAESRDGGSAA